MQMREKLAYALLLHLSALMLVFLFAGIVQLVFGPSLTLQLKNPVIASLLYVVRANLNYPADKLLLGLVTSIFFLPLDISILYWVTRELFEKDDVVRSLEDGIKHYPLFLVFFSDLYFFSFTYPWFTPVVLFTILRFLEPDTDWKLHLVSTVLIGSWFLPLGLVGRIENPPVRNALSLLFYLALVLPFSVHAWVRSEYKGVKK